ncbi:4-oxalocrotonate tautomerase [Brevibacillus parabrevis]|nr:4-oxalocrotonate tautomerase [Brevibacillus parabrevis]
MFMPIVQVSILEGRDKEQIRQMIEGITQAIADSLQVKPEQVRVLVTEVPPSHWGAGGVTKEQSRSL